MRVFWSARWGQILRGATLVVGADLALKALVEHRLNESVDLALGLRLDVGYNSGAAFGVGGEATAPLLILVTVGVLLALALAIVRDWLAYTGFGVALLIGGAVANLFDRIGDGRVTDYIDVGWWPAFNLADVAITAGVASIFWATWSQERTLSGTS